MGGTAVVRRAVAYISDKSLSPVSRMGLSVAKLKSNLDRSPSGQIAAIKRTFDRVKEKVANLDTLKHERKPHLKAVAAYPIFPDFEYWTNPYVTDVFLDDPTGRDIRVGPDSTDVPKEENDRAVLRIQEAVFKSLEPNDGGRPFLAMYLPDATSFEKLLIRRQAKGDDAFEFGEGEKFDYEHIRNYDYEVERKASRLVAVAIRENSALYMLTQGNLRLRRRRAKVSNH